MRTTRIVALLAVVALTVVAGSPSAAVADLPNPPSDGSFRTAAADGVPGSYIVVLRETPQTATRAAQDTTRQRLVDRYGGTVTGTYRAALTGYAVQMSEAAARRLSADPAVDYVEQDGITTAFDVDIDPVSWGLDRIDQTHLPLNLRHSYREDGTGVHAYVLDSGIRHTHSTFGGRASRAADFTDHPGVAAGEDCYGHGTFVAGTLGGSTYGVAKGVRIHAVKVLGGDCGPTGLWSWFIAGVDWVIANGQRPAVINASLGGLPNSAADAAVNRAINAGIPVVLAAGNENQNACNTSPARVPAAITVAASGINDARWIEHSTLGSNFGSCVDLFAPGRDIQSAWHTSNTASRVDSGTSAAAPHVAGAVAALLQRSPTATPTQLSNAIVGNATQNALGGNMLGTPNRMLFTGNDGFTGTSGDFNGDGRDDVIDFTRGSTGDVYVVLSNGPSFGARIFWHGNFAFGDEIPMVGDFNGDGRDDIAAFTRGTAADVYVALSTGSSFDGTGWMWHSSFAAGTAVPAVGDFNGDGRDDIAEFTRGTSGDVWVSLSTGSSFGPRLLWHNNFGFGAEVPAVGDFNGDGRDDIAAFTRGDTGDVYVALASGPAFVGTGVRWHDRFGYEAEVPVIGDINGDGRDDIIAFTRRPANDVFVATSNGSSAFVGTGLRWHDSFASADSSVVGAGDFNGDGRADIVVFARLNGSTVVSLNTGSGFGTASTWHSSIARTAGAVPYPGAHW